MEMERECIGCVFAAKYLLLKRQFAGKMDKLRGKTNSREEQTDEIGEFPATTVVDATTGWLWCSPWSTRGGHWWWWFGGFPERRVLISLCFVLGRGFWLSWVILGLVCSFAWSSRPSRFILSSITWLNSHESTIKTWKSQNKRKSQNKAYLSPRMNPKFPTNPCIFDGDQTPSCLNFCLSSSKTPNTSN